MNSFSDYYTLLGVASDAPSSAIKAAFKKLALQYHPDVYKGSDAHERMRLLLQAYQTLNDPAARRQYDAVRAEQDAGVGSSARAQNAHAQHGAVGASYSTTKRSRLDISPGARRDRQRHYDFPDFPAGKPVVVDLIDIDYKLTSNEAQTLARQGLLRGTAPETEAHQFYCHRCHHHWQPSAPRTFDGRASFPRSCPKCGATDWPEYLLLRCIHCTAVFESEQIRYEIGSYDYGRKAAHEPGGLCPPYELFPLCPYCGTAHWSPAEETRVGELRQRAHQRSLVLRFAWISVALLAIVLLGMVVVNTLH
ncbi:MAG: DnaJ domain-containing protein [Ktedonobacteraceae bacterium]|nr:DnaJ domain-containing protein [Ktedonobacteraceae bacterium]